jgi:hypothetical protein
MKRLTLLFTISVILLAALSVSACQPIVVTEGTEFELNVAPQEVEVPPGEKVHEVYPTGDPAQDIANVQAAIGGAEDGDTILLKAGIFNFGDWKTNPIPGGFVMINKGVTVRGDGLDADGNPKTVVLGGNFRNKNHWDHGEYGVFTFGGDTSGAVLDGIWFKEPHFYAVFISGFNGQTHENITVRNLKITDISQDIPEWDQNAAIGRSIDMGGNVPEWDIGGPAGTVTIENCYISNMGSLLDLDFVDPDSGLPYYTDPEGKPLPAQHDQASHAIGLWVTMSTNFVVRDNTVRGQHEGIVMEYMSGSGDILIADNDIVVETVTLMPNLQRGIRVTTSDAEEFPFASTRTVRIENNRIGVVGTPGEDYISEGILLSNDNGVEGFGATFVVTGNEVDVHDGYAAIVMGSGVPVATLRGAEINHNRITGTAQYGIVSTEGAQSCQVFDNDMTGFESRVASVGLYGPETRENVIKDITGTIDVGLGASHNEIVGETMAEPAEVVKLEPAPETGLRQISGDIHFPAPEAWEVDLWLRINFDLQEVDPNTHEADGFFNWEIFNFAERNWKRVNSHAEYVLFDEAAEAAVVVAQIDEKTGWGEGEPGEWACFWVRDGDLVGEMADQFGIHYYSDFYPEVGFKEFWPEDDLPPMEYAAPSELIDVELGDLVLAR